MLPALVAAMLVASPPAAAAPAATDVKPAMHAALMAVVTLQPYLARPAAFRAPENAQVVGSTLDVLGGIRHGFLQPGGAETASGAMATLFSRPVLLARAELARGDHEAARTRLAGVTGLCLNCHLRQGAHTDFTAAARLVDTLRLDPLERARLYATTRQFDEALALWKQALVAPAEDDVRAFEQAQALRLALAVAVRAKDDPALAIALLEQQRGRPRLPSFVARSVGLSLAEARAWQREKLPLAQLGTAALVSKARSLVEASSALRLPTSDDDHVLSLSRAAAALDEALRREPTGPHRAEALFLSGVVSATVDDTAVWQLESLYLESCVRENAAAPIGQRCLERLRERTFVAWRQKADMPSEVLSTLGELSALVAAPH